MHREFHFLFAKHTQHELTLSTYSAAPEAETKGGALSADDVRVASVPGPNLELMRPFQLNELGPEYAE